MTKLLKTWCEINLDNMVNNYRHTYEITGKKVICVIKANAYGHGAIKAATALQKAGCDMFAVSCFHEAMELREAGILSSILILGRIMPDEIADAIANDIAFSVGSIGFLHQVTDASLNGKKAKIHIKLNTGMNRTGFDTIHGDFKDLSEACSVIMKNKDIFDVEGVFSHFAKAEEDVSLCDLQYDCYCKGLQIIEDFGITPKIRHICNSAGTLNCKKMHLDATRLGIYLYGCDSDDKDYLPVMSFRSRILEIQNLNPGDGVSYGHDFTAKVPMKIAIIGAGYADGLLRYLSDGKGYILYKGKKCPIIGRVCMDMTMIDISEIDDACVLDEVTIFGKDAFGSLTVTEQAENAGTISYELLCSVSPRVPRIYL